MYTLAKSIDSSVAREQSSYFPVASQERLGISQTAQFQSGNQLGTSWHWTSRKNEAGALIDSTGSNRTSGYYAWDQGNGVWVEHNSRTEIPRSYSSGNSSIGNFYNYYAATAESGKWSMTSGGTNDSICPNGWTIPIAGNSDINKSWKGLLIGTYNLVLTGESSSVSRQLPLILAYGGAINPIVGSDTSLNRYGVMWTSSSLSRDFVNTVFYEGTGVDAGHQDLKSQGYAVRCVKK